MNSEDNNISEPHRRIVHRAIRLLETLADQYFKIKPQYGEDGFRERAFTRIDGFSMTNPGEVVLPTGEVCNEKVIEFLGLEGDTIQSDVAWIYFSCAYTVASARALQIGDQDLAWELLCDAHKFLGSLLATNKLETVFTQTVANALNSTKAANAAKGRHRQHHEMKMRAYEIVREHTNWTSQADAARKLTTRLKDEYGPVLSNPQDTILKWLRTMPADERKIFFPTLKKSLKKA